MYLYITYFYSKIAISLDFSLTRIQKVNYKSYFYYIMLIFFFEMR
ncbi:LOW QUALITY PROTEIN: hypothetical protein TorRG33x02_150640 [Trema orientale]|uniref:Uncharacterized protein n=1 Tax=Trema orientale TaxID=63057 RepID=A0A2P5EUH5_TREOI|nr:LOW QUALITY PROTEIN: hypothetical protein TorRG33x02_150640 [Trema orientale]